MIPYKLLKEYRTYANYLIDSGHVHVGFVIWHLVEEVEHLRLRDEELKKSVKELMNWEG